VEGLQKPQHKTQGECIEDLERLVCLEASWLFHCSGK